MSLKLKRVGIDTQWENVAFIARGCTQRDGVVSEIDCYRLARIARLAGAPMDKGAGIDLFKKSGDRVEGGEPLYRIFSCVPTDFAFATTLADEDMGYRFVEAPLRERAAE